MSRFLTLSLVCSVFGILPACQTMADKGDHIQISLADFNFASKKISNLNFSEVENLGEVKFVVEEGQYIGGDSAVGTFDQGIPICINLIMKDRSKIWLSNGVNERFSLYGRLILIDPYLAQGGLIRHQGMFARTSCQLFDGNDEPYPYLVVRKVEV